MIPIELNSPELGRRRPGRLRRRWSPRAEQEEQPSHDEEPRAAGLPRAVASPPLPRPLPRRTPRQAVRRRPRRTPLLQRPESAPLNRPFTPLPRAERAATPAEPESVAQTAENSSYFNRTSEQLQGAQADVHEAEASMEQQTWTQLSDSLALQVAEGQRGLILPLSENIFLVTAVPTEALKPELGLAPVVAEVLVSTATHALSQPETQEALVDLAQKAGKSIAQLTQQGSKGLRKSEKDDKNAFTPQPRRDIQRPRPQAEPLNVTVSPSPMPLPGELRPKRHPSVQQVHDTHGACPVYYVHTPLALPAPARASLRGDGVDESSLEVIIGALETHLSTLTASPTCRCQRRR